jgi:hypothetical protein
MKNKIFTAILLISLLLLSSICFASDTQLAALGNELHDSADKTKDSMQNVGKGLENLTNGVGGAMHNVGQGIQNTASTIGNGVQNAFTGMDNRNGLGTLTATDNGGYTATRLSTDAGANLMSNTAFIWLIMGIVGVIIVALTWYYVSQNNDSHRRR